MCQIINTSAFIQAFRAGEEKAFSALFRKYYSSLCFFAGSYLADADEANDVVQECFIKLWNVRPIVHHPAALKSYLYTMVRNACLHIVRHQKKHIRVITELQYTKEFITSEELNEITHAEMIRQVYERMVELPPRIQEVFRKFYIEGKNQDEIAGELHTSPKTVRNQRLRALVLLKEKLLILVLLFFFL